MSAYDIQELRKQFLTGNNSGLKQVYKDLKEDFINVLKSKENIDANQAESYLSDALIVFYENVMSGKLKESKSLKNYIIGIGINMHLREMSYHSKTAKKLDDVRLLLYNNIDNERDDEYKDQLKSICYEAMAMLNEKCRRIIVAYYIDRLTMKEIATYLDLSSADVAKTLKSRCYKTLLSHIEKVTK